MKDNLLDGHRGKVALSDTTRNLAQQQPCSTSNINSGGGKCDLKTPSAVTVGGSGGNSNNNDGTTATNFDDDYNEWELGIGDLIIDLDADIEKTNERNNATQHHGGHHHQNGSISVPASPAVPSVTNSSSLIASPTSSTSFSFLGSTQSPCGSNAGVAAMSNSKSSRGSIGSGTGSNSAASSSNPSACVLIGGVGNGNNANSSANGQSGAVEHQATVDKGLKMKIKRKTVGNKYSEAKHEIVQSDTKTSSPVVSENGSLNSGTSTCVGTSSNVNVACNDATPKSKHSSSKGRNGGHREKKEKNRDKDKGSSARSTTTTTTSNNPTVEMNGVLGVMSPSLKITSGGVSLSSPAAPATSVISPNTPATVPQNSSAASTAPQTLRNGPPPGTPTAGGGAAAPVSAGGVEPTPQTTFAPGSSNAPPATPLASSTSPPMPNLTLKLENKFSSTTTACSVVVKQEEVPSSPPLKRVKCEPVDNEMDSVASPEMKDTSTCTSVGTITEPDCLGPCEPGTSVMLEGIVWQETEGGVLVVNVTWRGKTYVGTLLDCTKHDWAPPRFCESPTSDVDNKSTKGRGKRGRGANNNCNEMTAFDVRNCVQSKLRNGKGRRTTINSSNFTVPSSPAKSESSASNAKRKGRPADLELTTTSSSSESSNNNKTSKRSRVQSRGGTPTASGSNEFPQPSSPALIECPEPNCSKKYKHINGLRYHQQHAHSGSSDGNKMDDTTTEDSKDVTNSSDNEESAQENMSVPPSPAMSFTNSVSPHPSSGRPLPVENNSSSSSSNVPSLPESDPYSLTPDLSTLASVAINDSKSVQKCSTPTMLHAAATSQELPVIVSSDSAKPPVSSCASVSSAPSVISVGAPSEGLSPTVPAASSVIHSSASDTPIVTPAVTVSIPTSHVVFNQGITTGISCITTTHTATVAMSCHNSASQQSPRTSLSTVSASTYVPVVSTVASVPVSSPSSSITSPTDKSKAKQQLDRLDKYKPKSPVATPAIRPIVPAPPTQLLALSANVPSHAGVNTGGHSIVTSSLKPIQPKPTILGEPTTINPALESLKKEKSKHKKKSKDKDRERKPGAMPLTPVKLSTHPNEECEPMEINPYPSLEAVPGGRDPMAGASTALPGAAHSSMSSLDGQKAPETSLDMSLADDNMNENIQSPAYSDISDANDTAPVLESEVPSGKEKEDKVGKGTPDTAQSPATNIAAYGMYPYYSQPPYLLPSVSPQNSVSGSQQPSIIEKQEQGKKLEQERIKENRPWSNPGGDLRERPTSDNEPSEKKQSRDNTTPNQSVIASPAATANVPLQDYQVQQPYPYSYGYVQGYPYSMEPAYHMHLLDSDPHYKQQYKQYLEEQQRLYKEQHHQQQQQQQQQQHHHHQQQQQQQQHNQQLMQQHSHQQHHHSQHHSHHQSKMHHSSVMKEDRDRSREHKERSSTSDKMSSSNVHGDHLSKIQHSSMSLVTNKDHDIREQQESRPPSLPTQSRGDNSTPSSASAALKEKQNENHQILKENIELKSQMEDNKNKVNQFEMAMLYERHREDMRRYYLLQERIIEQQQQKMEPGFHHHTHHHQTIQPHQLPSHSLSSKPHKEDLQGSLSHSKPSHYAESSRSSTVMSPAKPDHIKASSHPHTSSSPKGGIREPSVNMSKEYSSSSARESSSSKKDSAPSKSSERLESSSREEKCKTEKIKLEPKSEPEGQKPTMETTGPPPPPTNAYAYLHHSYLQPPPPHFPHMPFEPAHAVYRSGLNPMIMSAPSYGSTPYMHPQLRYVSPGACEIPAHSQQPDPLVKSLHQPGPPKALDLLHQVSQHYTTHKIHELQEHALMSPTPTSTPVSSSTPSTSSTTVSSKMTSSEPAVAMSKVDSANRDSSRSPPTQRHLHTHHHTHVGVGYPLYDPYGVAVQKT